MYCSRELYLGPELNSDFQQPEHIEWNETEMIQFPITVKPGVYPLELYEDDNTSSLRALRVLHKMGWAFQDGEEEGTGYFYLRNQVEGNECRDNSLQFQTFHGLMSQIHDSNIDTCSDKRVLQRVHYEDYLWIRVYSGDYVGKYTETSTIEDTPGYQSLMRFGYD